MPKSKTKPKQAQSVMILGKMSGWQLAALLCPTEWDHGLMSYLGPKMSLMLRLMTIKPQQ